ncbi:alpha/beta hydrolase [Mycoplasma tullyi]|uniref:Alpha/beta hydrolase n=1 Tax=Mycoplasma tullyi TaxID=1612150 RepID=A0A7D7XV43_9MOLU|nr:alpha/beta hydrolase [Mycoplasma tullyi]QMT98454.1 alpha/beta hydrolase [Mycoplasma tullyi]
MGKTIKGVDLNHLKVIKKINKNAEINLIFCHGITAEPGLHYKIVKQIKNVNHYSLAFPAHFETEEKFKFKHLNLEYFSKLLVTFFRENSDLKNIVLIGHSMGCAVIMMALHLMNKEERTRIKQILLGAPLTINTAFTALNFTKYLTADAYKADEKMIKRIFKDLFYKPDKFIKEFDKWFDLDFYKKNQNNQKKLAISIMTPITVKNILQAYHSFKEYEKVTFITADKDTLVPFRITRAYVKLYFKDAKHMEIKKAGHCFYLERKKEYIEILRGIIKSAKETI